MVNIILLVFLRKLRHRGSKAFAEDHTETDLNLGLSAPEASVSWTPCALTPVMEVVIKLHRDIHMPSKVYQWGWQCCCQRPPQDAISHHSQDPAHLSLFSFPYFSFFILDSPRKGIELPYLVIMLYRVECWLTMGGYLGSKFSPFLISLIMSVGSPGSRP